MRGALVLGAALFVSACGGPLDNIDVASATLSGVDWGGAAAVVGFSDTNATLHIVDKAGAGHDFPVQIDGPLVGILFDVGAGGESSDQGNNGGNDLSCLFQSSAALDLPAGKNITGTDLTGIYGGSKEALHLGIGGESHDVTNGAGVHLHGGSVNVGIGFLVGYEWLGIGVRE